MKTATSKKILGKHINASWLKKSPNLLNTHFPMPLLALLKTLFLTSRAPLLCLPSDPRIGLRNKAIKKENKKEHTLLHGACVTFPIERGPYSLKPHPCDQ